MSFRKLVDEWNGLDSEMATKDLAPSLLSKHWFGGWREWCRLQGAQDAQGAGGRRDVDTTLSGVYDGFPGLKSLCSIIQQRYPDTWEDARRIVTCALKAAGAQFTAESLAGCLTESDWNSLVDATGWPRSYVECVIANLIGRQGSTPGNNLAGKALFPLVYAHGVDGLLAQFCVERIGEPGASTGDIFLHPEQAVVFRDAAFKKSMTDATEAARRVITDRRLPDLVVRIERYLTREDREQGRAGGLIHNQLTGDSGGGALLFAIYSAVTGHLPEPEIVTSFTVAPGDRPVDGNCHPVGDAIEKLLNIAAKKEAGRFLCH